MAGHRKKRFLTEVRRHPFDVVVYFFTIATPLFELPQAITIYTTQKAESVSLLTWSFFLLDNAVWIIYALRRKQLPILITSIMYTFIELSIVAGIVLYS